MKLLQKAIITLSSLFIAWLFFNTFMERNSLHVSSQGYAYRLNKFTGTISSIILDREDRVVYTINPPKIPKGNPFDDLIPDPK